MFLFVQLNAIFLFFFPKVFKKYTKDNEDGRMTAQNLADFHLNEQKEELLIEECEKIVKAFEPEPNSTTMTMDGEL